MVYNQKKNTDLPFYERLNRYLHTLQFQFPDTYPSETITPPPWTVKLPDCNKSLIRFNKTETNQTIIKKNFHQIMSHFQEYNHIYTDASNTENGTAAAFTTASGYNSCHKLSKASSVFSGELTAILKALEYTRSHDNGKTVIITDSLSAVTAISQLYPSHPILILIKKELHHLQQQNKTTHFVRVPSQMDEIADRLARDATDIDELHTITRTAKFDLKQIFKEMIINAWQAEWNLSKSKLAEVKKTVLPRKIYSLERKQQTIVTRLRLGHTRITHSHLIDKTQEPTCEICHCPLTVKHILIECEAYNRHRKLHGFPSTLAELLKEGCNPSQLIDYLTDIGSVNEI
ncbi:uncharacterized protein [Leptinotarsa decemlineata]|uniref:uncharacterized protein n=1 Tax=Leptinotarsa decemlineata TaxID=7539 RepID=UPI003D309B05